MDLAEVLPSMTRRLMTVQYSKYVALVRLCGVLIKRFVYLLTLLLGFTRTHARFRDFRLHFALLRSREQCNKPRVPRPREAELMRNP